MLELINIGFRTEEGKEILKSVNLKIEDRFVAITGPNGSGKSTLAKIIAGIYQPTDGQILFNGKDITNMSISERAKLGISFAFQQPVRFKGLKVKDILSIASGGEKNINECCNLLSEVGLCARDYIDRDLDQSLSGGEMKRIEIATLLARNTELNIFDEPEAGIDLWSFQNLIRVFEKMNEKTNGNIIIISHQERILNIADKIIYLKNGTVDRYEDKDSILPTLLAEPSSACKVLTDKMED
ncbi:MAG: ATP-binding cassette domain-containing protein [Lachnospiraceae bacterium]|nr:ATP-binding cassette domain-containing protein [Lachnospiraceae bacterium]